MVHSTEWYITIQCMYAMYLLQTCSLKAVNVTRHNNLKVTKTKLVSDVSFVKGLHNVIILRITEFTHAVTIAS